MECCPIDQIAPPANPISWQTSRPRQVGSDKATCARRLWNSCAILTRPIEAILNCVDRIIRTDAVQTKAALEKTKPARRENAAQALAYAQIIPM